MELEMLVENGLLTLKASDCPAGMILCTAPLPFQVSQYDQPTARAMYGLRNEERTQIFIIPGRAGSTPIPHIPSKTGVRIVNGTTVVGNIKTTPELLEKWWVRTQDFIKNRGKTPKKQDLAIEKAQAKATVAVEVTGAARARTHIVLD